MQTKNRLAMIVCSVFALTLLVAPGWAVDDPAKCNPDDCVVVCASSCDAVCPPGCEPCPEPCPWPCAAPAGAAVDAECMLAGKSGAAEPTVVQHANPAELLNLDQLITAD